MTPSLRTKKNYKNAPSYVLKNEKMEIIVKKEGVKKLEYQTKEIKKGIKLHYIKNRLI